MVQNLHQIRSDKQGNIYVGLETGDIIKYDLSLKELRNYSPQLNSPMDNFDPGLGFRLFVFYEDQQLYMLADRNLTQFQTHQFPSQFINLVEYATLSDDQNIWVLDPIDFSLKKISVDNNLLISQSSIESFKDLEWGDLFYMKEYDSFIFVGEKNAGIHVFDNFGFYNKKIAQPDIIHFDYYKDNLVLLTPNKILILNIYSEQSTNFAFQIPGTPKEILINKNNVVISNGSAVYLYENPIKK